MNDILFYNSFAFRKLHFTEFHHTDNSHGIGMHFIGKLVRGNAVISTLDGDELSLCEGDVFYLPMGLRYHSYWYGSEDSDRAIEWDSYGFKYIPSATGKKYKPQKICVCEHDMSLLDAIDKTVKPTTSYIGYLYLFLGNIIRQMEPQTSDEREALFDKARAYISKNPAFHVSELARHCNVSESGIYAFFRSYANTTPIELKNRIQAEMAAELLSSTDLSVEEIADRLGFCSSAYLRKIFKAQFGKTPSELRKSSNLI